MKKVFKFDRLRIVVAFAVMATTVVASVAAPSGVDAFYVWQQLWSKNVISAVCEEPSTTMYPLVAVVPPKGKSSLVNIPWGRLSVDSHQYVPVVRIPLNAFRRWDLVDELGEITSRLRSKMAPHKLREIQFDLDCPESRLGEYLALVKNYRNKFPGLRLSITALPSHLKHKVFRELAASVDYYVIQVHGIEIPKTLDIKVELLNMQTAEKALRCAEEIKLPYRVALPCYAYELNFDPDSGDFMFLTAEKTAKQYQTTKLRAVALNRDLIELQKSIANLDYACGVIWFRLPVVGDRLCLPRKDLAAIQAGIPPKPKVECRIVPISDSTIELELYNDNEIHFCEAVLKLKWPQQKRVWDVYRNMRTKSISGQLPTEIIVPVPLPGEKIKIGWFEVATNSHPQIKVILK